MYEAIQFYKRAVQLVPDIEFRLYESTKVKLRERFDHEEKLDSLNTDSLSINKDEDEEAEDDDTDLFTKLSRIVNRNQCVCFPLFEQSVRATLF